MYVKLKGFLIPIFLCVCFISFSDIDIESIVNQADALLESGSAYSISEMTVFQSGKARPTMKVEDYSMTGDGTTYSLSIYRAPAKMKGTAYLMIANDIWVKFGNTGRIRKLSSSAKKNSAGGTDFSYNDMSDNNKGLSKQYSITLLDEKVTIDGKACYKVKFSKIPETDAPYEQLIAYITHEKKQYIKIEYFENEANIKTLTLLDWKEIAGRNYPFGNV